MEENETPQPDLSAERLARCIPVAKEVLKMIANGNLPIGILTDQEVDDGYKEISLTIIGLFLAADLNYIDRNFVFQLVKQAIENVNEKVVVNIETSFNLALEKLWGKDIQELKLKDIDNVLKKQYNVGVA